METACQITSIRELPRVPRADRIYYGNGFCERLLPSVIECKRVLAKIRKLGKKVSLVTPPATDDGLRRIQQLLRLLDAEDEVVVNDFGILYFVHKRYANPIHIGRVLGRPVLYALKSLEHDSENVREYLSALGGGARGLEVDSFNADLISRELSSAISFSYYDGPVFWTTTRRCAFNSRSVPLDKFAMCRRECLESRALIMNTHVQKKFMLEGNRIRECFKSTGVRFPSKLFARVIVEK